MSEITFYRDVPVLIREKCGHVIRKGRKYLNRTGFGTFLGDIPVARYNEVTGKMEPVENKRGMAYALRNALRNRKDKRCRVKHRRAHR